MDGYLKRRLSNPAYGGGALDESSAYKRFALERSMAEQQTEKPTNAHPLQMARYEASASKQLYHQTDNAEKSTTEKNEADGDKKKKKKKKKKEEEGESSSSSDSDSGGERGPCWKGYKLSEKVKSGKLKKYDKGSCVKA